MIDMFKVSCVPVSLVTHGHVVDSPVGDLLVT